MRLINADALREELLWCKEQSGTCDDHWNDIVERLDAQPTIGGWISVKDRLPERYEPVLTYDIVRGLNLNWLVTKTEWSWGYHICYWMPLPEPPKEEEENGDSD